MNQIELRETVMKKFRIGQQIPIRIKDDMRGGSISAKATIIQFNPNTVLTEHNGYKESFTYWDFLRMTVPREIKQSDIYIPDIGRRRKDA